jgi:hypothetical protein
MGVEGVDVARSQDPSPQAACGVSLTRQRAVKLLGSIGAWAEIHDDLGATSAAWHKLEADVARLVARKGKPAPTRLRLHDILLWTRATERWEIAHQYGREALAAEAQ